MTIARAVPIVAALLLPGCGLLEDEENGPSAPVGNSASVGQMTQGGGGSGGLTTTGGLGPGTSSGGTSTSDGADSTGPAPIDLGTDVLFIGELDIGDGAWSLPLSCSLRFFFEDQLDPVTGIAIEWEADIPIVIEVFPQEYMVTRNDVPATVDFGAEGYIGLRCDLDGDGMMDNVGGFFPGLPAELVTLPAPAVDIDVVFL